MLRHANLLMKKIKAQSRSKVPISAQVDEAVHRRLGILANETGLPNAYHIRKALIEYLDRMEDELQAKLDL